MGVDGKAPVFFLTAKIDYTDLLYIISDSLSDAPHMFTHCAAQSILGVRFRPFVVGGSEW